MVSKNKKIAVIGLQCGDEGKGVRVSHYIKKAIGLSGSSNENRNVLAVRWQGGGNAGHTVWMNGLEFKLHQIPSGVLTPGTFNLIGEGVLFDPLEGMKEIKELQAKGISISPENFGIASNCHVTLDYHVKTDQKNFMKKDHTSTGRGIKPTSVDKYNRVGLRFEEFLDRETFIKFLKEKKFPDNMPTNFGSIEEFVDSYGKTREFLSKFCVLQSSLFKKYKNKYIIGEGAQGYRLDVDKGLYPGVTSTNPGIVPFRPDLILGVVKLYESSVGKDRPFVSRMEPELENSLRKEFGEFGTTTGRPRDIGWFDAVSVGHALEDTQTDFIIGTCGDKLDCLARMKQKIKIVVGYKIGEKTYKKWDKSFHNRKILFGARPIYEEFEPWTRFVDEDGKLSPNAQKYIDRIEELTQKKFILLGTGPGEEDVFEVKDIFKSLPGRGALNEIQEEVDNWIKQYKIGYFKPLEIIARLAEETGELAREISHRFGPKKRKAEDDVKDVGEEIADIIFTVSCLANSLNIKLDDSFESVMTKHRTRDGERYERVERSEEAGDNKVGFRFN